MFPKGLPHRVGSERAPSERDDLCVGPREKPQHDLLLADPEGVLALTVEEDLEWLSELALELAVDVEGRCTQLGRDRARCARLAGAHEAGEHDRAAPRGSAGTGGALARYRLH
jgi:hypothetical protein